MSDIEKLQAPTPQDEIKTKPGKGGGVQRYIDARFVMHRLDEAIGAHNWQDKYRHLDNGTVMAGIGIFIADRWVWKWDIGEPSNFSSEKGAVSDAFKRAGVKWGIARDLYEDESKQVKTQSVKPVSRPLSPEKLQFMIAGKANGYKGGKEVSSKQRGLLVRKLSELFPDDIDRYAVCEYLAGAGSSKDIESGFVKALLDWLNIDENYNIDLDAEKEARAVLDLVLKAQGQQEF